MGHYRHLWLALVIGMGGSGLSACSGGESALGTPPPTSLGPTPPSIATPVVPEVKKPTTVDPLTQGAYQPMVTLLGGDAEKKTDDDGKKDDGTKGGGKAKQDDACKGKPSWACKTGGDKTDGGNKTGGGKTGGGKTGDGKTGGGAGDDPDIVGKTPDVKKTPVPGMDDDEKVAKADDNLFPKNDDPPAVESDDPVASGPAKFDLYAASAEGLNGYVVVVAVEHTTGRLLATYWDPKEGWGRKTAVIDDKNKYEGQPAAVVNGSNGNIELFATTAAGRIYRWYWSRGDHQWQSSGSWSFAHDQAIGKFRPGIAAVYDPNATAVRVFARTEKDQRVRMMEWKPGQNWDGSFPLPTPVLAADETVTSRPSAIYSALTRTVQVFATTSYQRLVQWSVLQDGTVQNYLLGTVGTVLGPPTVLEDAGAKYLYVLAKQAGQRLRLYWWMPGHGWADGAYSKEGEDGAISPPTAIFNPSRGGTDVFAVHKGQKNLWHQPLQTDGSPGEVKVQEADIADWEMSAVINPSNGFVELFGFGKKGKVRHWWGTTDMQADHSVMVDVQVSGVAALAYPPTGYTEWVGGNGGGPKPFAACPPGEVISGVFGVSKIIQVDSATAVAEEIENLHDFGVLCRPLRAEPGVSTKGKGTPTGSKIECPNNNGTGVVTRLDISSKPYSGDTIIGRVDVYCGVASLDKGHYVIQGETPVGGLGTDDRDDCDWLESECDVGKTITETIHPPTGALFTGMGMRRGSWIDSLGFSYSWITFP